ncbi:putative phosphoglycerate mutase [Murinocardiopsis flavida]|uniref:Putative phosphoglycerate mutase n=1 Tax=Murinocardiopsis flavida TaxID=645275 RepID=A0A2P8DU60_9ACTN|nr:histidine phosphatase family protein [Murinocardiopsis flavida]PSL00743.1 putative phosphoglycerate mutase [Murinocardiopsis flavida]
MTETRRVILLRHGQTDWNADKRFQGHSDIPLNEAGLRQARHAAGLLVSLRPDAIVASDLKRAAATAYELAERTGLPVEFDKGLRERSGGSWEGLTRSEIRERWPEEFITMDIPDGEDMALVGNRVNDAIERGLGRVPEHGVLVAVSHGAALRAGINRMLGFPPEKREALGPLGNCSWSMLGPARSGAWRLLEHNAASLPDESALGDDR